MSVIKRTLEIVFGITVVIGVTLGGSMANMWIMMNVMQIWFLTGLLDLLYPISIQIAMNTLELANFENPLMSSLTQLVLPEDNFVDEPFNPRFASLQFDNSYFINNMADLLPTLTVSLCIFSLAYFLHFIGKYVQNPREY